MKNLSLIISIVALAAATVFGVLYLTDGSKKSDVATEEVSSEAAASKGDIVYIDLDRILMEYDMANDLRSVVETKVQNIEAEVNRRGKKLENEVKSFQEKLNKGLMTRSVAEVQQQKSQQLHDELYSLLDQFEQEHIARITRGDCRPQVGILYLELIEEIRKIARHLENINDRAGMFYAKLPNAVRG